LRIIRGAPLRGVRAARDAGPEMSNVFGNRHRKPSSGLGVSRMRNRSSPSFLSPAEDGRGSWQTDSLGQQAWGRTRDNATVATLFRHQAIPLRPAGSAAARRLIPRRMTWWRTPVVDPAQRAGPKVPDGERKGTQARPTGRGEPERFTRLIRLQRILADAQADPYSLVVRAEGKQAAGAHLRS